MGQAGKQAGEASDPRHHHHVLSESRSPAWTRSGPLAGHGVVVLGGGTMRNTGLASVWEAGTAMLSTSNYQDREKHRPGEER